MNAAACSKCGKPLSDPVSRSRGYGPVCFRQEFGAPLPARGVAGSTSPTRVRALPAPAAGAEPLAGFPELERDLTLLFRAARLVIRAQIVTVAGLMQQMQIGERAAVRVLDQLSQLGILARPQRADGDRVALVRPERLDDALRAIQHHTPVQEGQSA